MGRTEGLCAVLMRLVLPNRAPAVELIIVSLCTISWAWPRRP